MSPPYQPISSREPVQHEYALAVDRLLAPVRRFFRVAGIVLLAVLIAIPFTQIVLRQVFGAPFVGAEELASFTLICVIMVSVPYSISSGASVRMEELLLALPSRWQRRVNLLIAMCGALAFGFAAWSTGTAMARNLNNATPTLAIPYWIFFSAGLIGFALTALEFALVLLKAWRGLPLYITFDAEQPPDEPDLQ